MQQEVWKKIKGFDNYVISNTGRVLGKNGSIKIISKGSNKSILLFNGDKYIGKSIHKLLKEYFSINVEIQKNVKSLENEEWKAVVNYEGLYEVSNLGRIKSLNYNNQKEEKLLKTTMGPKGESKISLAKNNEKETTVLSIVVADAFIPKIKSKPMVVHLNGDKQDNRVGNLKRMNNSEAQRLALDLGLKVTTIGGENPCSIMIVQLNPTTGDVIKIWDAISDVKRKLKIPTTNICKVLKGKRSTAGGYSWVYYDEYMNTKNK
jgi:hypothetical protein